MITYYFHVSKQSRIKYQLETNLFSLRGNLIISNFNTARVLSDKINKKRFEERKSNDLVSAGMINGLGLLHEIFHLIIRHYEEKENPGIFSKSIDYLEKQILKDELEKTLLKFVEEFPPLDVYQNKITALEYLNSKTEWKSNKEIILEEIILLNLENINPATYQLKEFYSDEILIKQTTYNELIEKIEIFFEKEKPVGSNGLNLIAFLRKPIITNPYNIDLQLDFIKENWKYFLEEKLHYKILSGKDLLKEDYKIFERYIHREKQTPPVPEYSFTIENFQKEKQQIKEKGELSPEEFQYYQSEEINFTPDNSWMPNVVMIAKNTYVWLDQLSIKYNRDIKRLDQIPDEELDQLAQWNFNALWLIGIWERSSASQKIKLMTGNPDAGSSAYSIFDYVIAEELGGQAAFEILKQKALKRGIRLSSDMVPNHTGIFSKWIIEKPEYFIQCSHPPFPVYKFTGPNLSDDPNIEIRIEDQYYNRTDAAVVFERINKITGEKTYIYHGNDGTNMPWNDTAQLNLLSFEVRETLIQTILYVAKQTPIIRFDAAMTLTKKHYQRLWFPIPGTGGAIPSRADYAMTRSQFDEFMPNEFWREVVERINKEMPDTLLLAEAFWLMESYFVRSLGMHRVYNSAFMHMFMKEENYKYKQLIKNTLLYDPQILKRYVNFMSNPDEETAVNQFGKGDKYFGVATVMITMPGLPMFAHGQIEGFSEKYGMEYKRAYYNETPDYHLIWRHIKEIFPLLKIRYLFSEVTNFNLFDFIDSNGEINDNVFAYTNSKNDQKAFIIYNNSYSSTSGFINYSHSKINPDNYSITNVKIAEALNFKNSNYHFYICKDFIKEEEFLFNGNDVWNSGFHFSLSGYERKVFVEFREVIDLNGKYIRFYNSLKGKNIKSVENMIKEFELEPLHTAMTNWLTSDVSIEFFNRINNFQIDRLSTNFLVQLNNFIPHTDIDNLKIILINSADKLNSFWTETEKIKIKLNGEKSNSNFLLEIQNLEQSKVNRSYLFIYEILKLFQTDKGNKINIFNDYLLRKPLYEIFGYLDYGFQTPLKYDLLYISNLISTFDNIYQTYSQNKKKIKKNKMLFDSIKVYLLEILQNNLVMNFIHYHTFENTEYYNKERFEYLFTHLIVLWNFENFDKQKKSFNRDYINRIKFSETILNNLFLEAEKSKYKYKDLIEILKFKNSQK